MQNSKTSYTGNGSSLRSAQVENSQSSVAEASVIAGQDIDLGIIAGSFLKRNSPENAKALRLKCAVAEVAGQVVDDSSSFTLIIGISLYLYRHQKPVIANVEALRQAMASESIVPICINAPCTPSYVVGTSLNMLKDECRYQRKWTNDLFIGPVGVGMFFIERFASSTGYTLNSLETSVLIDYDIVDMKKQHFERLVLAYTSAPQTVERRGQ